MEKTQVFKLGGAFFAPRIIKKFRFFKDRAKRLYVVSAVKGVTRLLEIIFKISVQKDLDDDFKEDLINRSLKKFVKIHRKLIVGLFKRDRRDVVLDQFNLLVKELRETIFSRPENDDQYYSSILKYGELASSKILSNYLLSIKVENVWFDARDYVLTDSNFHDAKIDSVDSGFEKHFSLSQVLITQGFIGKSITGKDTVLGYDGSDESAARFAMALSKDNEVEVTFFKDVLGVYNGNPKKDKNLKVYTSLTPGGYTLLVKETETYVVRPDSIVDLAQANIKAIIRSYLDLSHPGTVITRE